MKLSGAKILLESLKKEGVNIVFGYPGGAILPTFDELYKEKDIRVYLVRHEQNAAFAADGYARVTGHPGTAIVTSGPGATNTVTGIASAYMDSIPIVVISGQVSTSMIGSDAFQEVDTTGITRPITKWNRIVKRVEDLAWTVKAAYYIANSGRPGPVVIDLPKDVQVMETEFNYPDQVDIKSYKPQYKGHPIQIKKAVEVIKRSKRPIIYCGGGVITSNASKELVELAEKLNAPVTTTLMALGAIDSKHPLNLGMLGMHGSVATNYAVSNCDVLIAIGARFDDRVTGKVETFAPNAVKIHIDIDPSSISKNVVVDVPIVGDVKEVLKDLIPLVDRLDTEDWLRQISEWQREHPLRYNSSESVIKPQYLVEVLSDMTYGNAIVTADVGQHLMWVAQYYKFKYPRTWLCSGGLGAMGYAFPAGIGAKVAKPDAEVIAVVGDGAFQMSLQDLASVSEYNLAVKIIIMNNFYLGMVRQWQELFYGKRYSSVFLGLSENQYLPDLVKLADAYNIKGLRVEKPSELKSAISTMLQHKGPFLLDVWVEKEENVLPMVPAGRGLMEMIEAMA
ncbi:MAG: biosynthetic-type acetolactate synthase large subunit [Spirochaetia bacterium]|nr:biosynthetic-type acetolactate synthase large subunit [Spirochaetota bacterium]MCX8097187.1 biosynthetic-type acetolactate synthase large subunit [Spirochaetota bacterium]MDW8112640.1 biosynthetic-type acetolactate synthase large subunit [Spirochaetia bacterium]